MCRLYYSVFCCFLFSITESDIEPLHAQLGELELEITDMVRNIFSYFVYIFHFIVRGQFNVVFVCSKNIVYISKRMT